MNFELIIISILSFLVIALFIGLVVCYLFLSKLKRENNDLKVTVNRLKNRANNNYTFID